MPSLSRRPLRATFLALGLVLVGCPAQIRPDPYEIRQVHDRNGIGKFYLGREIARVMGHEAAPWLERPEREREEEPQKLIEALRLRPGDVVADVGAGTGYLTFRVAPLVGDAGKVYAVDIQPEMVEHLKTRKRQTEAMNVFPILGTETDPALPEGSVDIVLLVDVYHEFTHPFEMMTAVRRALKPGGRAVLVEYRGEDPDVPIKKVHKMTEAQVRKEMEYVDLSWMDTVETLPRQHILIYAR